MAAADVSDANDARWLTVHAVVVGVGWFVVAFAGLIGLQVVDGLREWVETWPTAAQGMAWTVVVVAAVPFAWPFYIAIGWYESGLASRLRAADASVRRRAARLLAGQAVGFAIAAAAAGAAAWQYRHADGEHVTFAWVPLAMIAALHAVTARTLRP